MNAKQARKEGLVFTGAYSSRDDEYIKNSAKKIREDGFRAVMVQEEHGKSVYADRSYVSRRDIVSYLNEIDRKEKTLEQLRLKYEAEVARVEDRTKDLVERVEKYKSLVASKGKDTSWFETREI